MTKSKDEPMALRVVLYDHETIKALGVEAPKDLNKREWSIGEPIVLKIIGIERHGTIEGIKVI